jgi:hypothetical protein
MKRQRSRNRGSGGGKPQHNANRAFESNGPDGVKIRGAAQHVFEKYQQLARDALTSGDRVLAENYQQHAEHYFRVLRAVQPQRAASDIIGRETFASGVDIDFEDDSSDSAADGGDGEADRGEWRQDGRYEARRDDRPRDRNGGRDERPRDDRQRDDRPRDDRQRDDRQRDERPRDDRQRDDRQREERPRDDRQRDDRQRSFRDERPRDERRPDPLPVVEPRASPLPSGEAERASGPMLRSQDGSASQAPAFLQPRAEPPKPETAEEAEPRPRARRRRAPRTFEGAAGESAGGEPAGVSEDA